MKAKNLCLIVFAIFAMIFFSCCVGAVTGPDNPNDKDPHPKSVLVKYVRVQPIPCPEAANLVTVVWTYGTYQGGTADMPAASDGSFTAYAQIETETIITIYVADPQEWNGSAYWVCKYIYIDGIELAVNYTYGSVKFIYHNDGTVKVNP